MMYFNQLKKNLSSEELITLKQMIQLADQSQNFMLFAGNCVISEHSLIGTELNSYFHYSLTIDENDIRSVLILKMTEAEAQQMTAFLTRKQISIEVK